MNIDSANEHQVVCGINEESIDDDDLVGRDTWKRICAVRGRNFNSIDAGAWTSLCARRGYLLSRANPRGF
jgi:hypothetical protein